MKKIAIIGASYLQEPLIQKAKSRGLETHVFAWAAGDVGEKSADFFYPISIVEKEAICEKCREIGIDGVCSIASDLAAITVNYVADRLGLTGNDMDCVRVSTNKHSMRQRFEEKGDPSPKSIQVEGVEDLKGSGLHFPVIVKPVDRSGSRGISKVDNETELKEAIERAKGEGFIKRALVEEFVEGREYSVEYISWEGQHHFLSMTQKYTTGKPVFIETGHLEPAPVDQALLEKVQAVVTHALDSLGIRYGASHSEIKIRDDGEIRIIEIGGRMGGDFIGSSLVELSTGYDFVGAVLDVALGRKPESEKSRHECAAIRFVFDPSDLEVLRQLENEHPEILIEKDIHEITGDAVTSSGDRFGYFLFASHDRELLERYMPNQPEE